MSLSKLMAGRKKECAVWEYYTYDAVTDKSTCLVLGPVDKETKKECGVKISGKNSTNLGAHLSRLHKETYACFMEKERLREAAKKGTLKRPAQDTANTSQKKQMQTLQDCIHRRVITWARDSSEHKQRVDGVLEMLIGTCYPVTVVDHPSFREMVRVMDGKFELPGHGLDLASTIAAVLLDPDLVNLLDAAKRFIISLSNSCDSLLETNDGNGASLVSESGSNDRNTNTSQPQPHAHGLQRFKFLSARMGDTASTSGTMTNRQETLAGQLNRYMSDILSVKCTDALQFWQDRRVTYSKLAPIAEDLITAPASQAYVERIFSLCGMLTAGRRNRMKRSLEMRVFLKLNKNISC